MSLDGVGRPTRRDIDPASRDRPTARELVDAGRDRPTVRERPPADGEDRPTEREAGGDLDRPTVREGSGTSRDRASRDRPPDLPRVILDRYEYLHDLAAARGGSGARLVVCREMATGAEVVVKWYRWGDAFADDRLMKTLEGADPRHVLPTRFEHGDGELWEVQEYFQRYGTLRDVIDAAPDHTFGDDFVRSYLTEMADALDYIHSLGVVHRDLKPENVFVRELAPRPLDLVIGDFNTSLKSAVTVNATVQATWRYASPESGSGEVSPRGDWWPVGVMAYELLVGRHPFFDPTTRTWPNEETIRVRVFNDDIDLSAVSDQRWSLLLKGLLTWEKDARWTGNEVRDWLAGGSPAVDRSGPRTEGTQVQPTTRALPGVQPFVFRDVAYTDPTTLTEALVGDWDAAVQELAGRATERLREFLISTGLTGDVIGQLVDASSPTRTLIALQYRFVDGIPRFAGRELTQTSLQAEAEAAERGDVGAAAWVHELRARDVLDALSRYADNAGEVAKAAERLDTWWRDIDGRIDRLGIDGDERTAVDDRRGRMEGQLLLAAFDETAGRTLRAHAVEEAGRRDGVIEWAREFQQEATGIDVDRTEHTGFAALALAVLPGARAQQLQHEQGLRRAADAARREARGGVLRARRRRYGAEFWVRLRIIIPYAVIAGLISSVTLDGSNVIEWWNWPTAWAAVAAAGIGALMLSLVVFIVQTYVAPLRLGGRRQILAGAVFIALGSVWNQVLPVDGRYEVAPGIWLIPVLILFIAFVVAEAANAVVGYRPGVDSDRTGGGDLDLAARSAALAAEDGEIALWERPARQRYVRGLTRLTVVVLVPLMIVMVGFAVEVAAGGEAFQSLPEWVNVAARSVADGLPAMPWGAGSAAGGLAFVVGVVAITIGLTGVQRDIARRFPGLAASLLAAMAVLDLWIVVTAPWELAMALFYSAFAVIGVVIGAVIIGIIFAML